MLDAILQGYFEMVTCDYSCIHPDLLNLDMQCIAGLLYCNIQTVDTDALADSSSDHSPFFRERCGQRRHSLLQEARFLPPKALEWIERECAHGFSQQCRICVARVPA